MNKSSLNARDYAIGLAEDGLVSWETLARAMILSMSTDDVRWALEANELSPRFLDADDADDADDETEEDSE